MFKLLDLGCGRGDSWRSLRVSVENCRVIGIDIQCDRLIAAHRKYSERGWHYVCARGENLPLPAGSVHGVFCEVALPYMNIPCTLAEVHRVLTPGGWFRATLHSPRFTLGEFWRAFPKPKASLFRVFVFLNGMVLHLSGEVISLGKVAESFQTNTGMRIALRRAGFTDVCLRHDGPRFFVNARRNETPDPETVIHIAA